LTTLLIGDTKWEPWKAGFEGEIGDAMEPFAPLVGTL